MTERDVFIISDRTALTAETLSHSLLTQFPGLHFTTRIKPFTDTLEKVTKVVEEINSAYTNSRNKPLVFCTFADQALSRMIGDSDCAFFDFFSAFIGPMETTLGERSSHSSGSSHGVGNRTQYATRIDAVNYAMRADDGMYTSGYARADIILVGVSRAGKTPTSLYLAMHFGIYAANYPLVEEDLERQELVKVLVPSRQKLFGLTINPERLQRIRQERRSGGRYADIRQCRQEVAQVEALFRRFGIPFVDTTAMSIEEISTTILYQANLRRSQHV